MCIRDRLGGGRAAERTERVGEDHARALKERGKLLTGRLGGFQLQQKGGARGGAALGDQAEQLARALVVLADGPRRRELDLHACLLYTS